VLIIESTDKGSALPYHRWKLVLVLSALRHFVQELRDAGYEVDHRVATSYAEGIRAHVAEHAPSEVLVQEPAEYGIAQSLAALRGATGGSPLVRIVPDRRFLTSRADFQAWAKDRKQLRMEDFYRWQRRRLGVLVEMNGDPVGGQWNFDPKNRKSAAALRKHGTPNPPAPVVPDAITAKVIRLVDRMPGHWGTTEGFDLPVTRAQALAALEEFITHRLVDFGPYEDAMLRGERYLYHSRLSAAMNVGLLHPKEMIERAVAAWSASTRNSELGTRDAVPLASVEGFVRQILGWREYVNGIYWREMPGFRQKNYFHYSRPLPQAYWDPAETELACLSDSVRMVRDTGYAHHIHRLMVLCNFAVLTGVDPLRLSEWFWAGFADAMEWVELPNVVGMGTFADGGLLASKPYVSSAAYIGRMSDYCVGCRYDPKLRAGPDACPFNYLYWSFLDDIRVKRYEVGQRMALVLKQLAEIPPAEIAAMRAARAEFLATLKPDSTGWAFHHDQG
jgi:deoxyribodipyrimidine photolyase-related protein